MKSRFFHPQSLPDSAHSLGTFIFPSGVKWIDRRQLFLVGQQVRRTLNGSIHIRAQRSLVGQPITLEIQFPNSWLYESKYQELKTLADIPGAQFTFTWQPETQNPGSIITDPKPTPETYLVMFRHNDAPALEFEHFDGQDGRTPLDYDLWVGQVKLLTTGVRT